MFWSVERHNNKWVGVILVGVFVILILTVSAGVGASDALFEFWPAALGILILLGMFGLELSLRYRLDSEEVTVMWLLYSFSFLRETIESIELAIYTPTARTFGYGGVGILYGRFHVKPQGKVRIYGGRNPNASIVLSLKDAKTIILTPEDPKRFLEELKRLGYPV